MMLQKRQDAMVRALSLSMGNVAQACRATGISRTTHYDWVKRDSLYAKKCENLSLRVSPFSKKAKKAYKPMGNKRCGSHGGTSGFVYIVHYKELPYYKIGRTGIKLTYRLAAIQNGCPLKLEVFFAAKVSNCINLERELHREYALKRVQGEWFELSSEDLIAIKERVLQYGAQVSQISLAL